MDKIMEAMVNGWKTSKEQRKLEGSEFQAYCQDFELLYMHKEILYRKIMTNEPRLGPKDRLCLPKGLQEVSLYWAHAHESVVHLKVGASQKRMRARFFFPSMYNVTEKYVRGCHKCLRDKGEHLKT